MSENLYGLSGRTFSCLTYPEHSFMLKNALASPDVPGTSSALAFGAALGIVMGGL
ncbi:hypothetical protein ACQYE5_003133 [Enterobacter cancerogenus]